MDDSGYALLSPFIRSYIYSHGWNHLHDFQSRAIKVILKSEYHLLISSGTASGKTEAAFFPVLTALETRPSASIGVLYIGPLKALINDQFARMEDLLAASSIPVWHWHGDVSASEKKRALKNPAGVMQITPESLESLVMRSPADIRRLFSDLRFVIIDEVHTFMGTERGAQVQCLLQRISAIAGCTPRRIGLSATISDYRDARRWLAAGTDVPVSLAASAKTPQRRVAVRYYHDRSDDTPMYPDIYDAVSGTNAIVFVNSRKCAETAARRLRETAADRGHDASGIMVHHGSLSGALRAETESALKNSTVKTVAVATSTLELGIDIGGLDQVVQLGAPSSCSSYVQRLGRSGRRGNAASMQFFLCDRQIPDPLKIPWGLIKLIAILELYGTEGWIEPFTTPKKPFSLLYHQTMSMLYASGGMKPGALARSILSLTPFAEITKDEYRTFLKYLLASGQLERNSDGLLCIGLAAEPMINHYGFLAVFAEAETYTVRYGSTELGTIEEFSGTAGFISLGGKSWEVISVDDIRKVIEVRPASRGGSGRFWHGTGLPVHAKVVRKMRDVLLEDTVYPYLDDTAAETLEEARLRARHLGICTDTAVTVDGTVYLFPWTGSRELDTLSRALRYSAGIPLGMSGPVYLTVPAPVPAGQLRRLMKQYSENLPPAKSLVAPGEVPMTGKYAAFVAPELRMIEFGEDTVCRIQPDESDEKETDRQN